MARQPGTARRGQQAEPTPRRLHRLVLAGEVLPAGAFFAGLMWWGRHSDGWAGRPDHRLPSFAANDWVALLAFVALVTAIALTGPRASRTWRKHALIVNVGLAAALGTSLAVAAYVGQGNGEVVGVTQLYRALMLFVGDVYQPWPDSAPLAFQTARLLAIAATLSVVVKAITAVLWPTMARFKADLSKRVVLVQADGAVTRNVVERLAEQCDRNGQLLVALVPDARVADSVILRELGAEVLVGSISDTAVSRQLLQELVTISRPLLMWRRFSSWLPQGGIKPCSLALEAAYLLLDDDIANAEAARVLESLVAAELNREGLAAPTLPPRIVVRIDHESISQDFLRRQRGAQVGALMSTIGVPQQTGLALAQLVLSGEPDTWPNRVLVQGDNDITLAFLTQFRLQVVLAELQIERAKLRHPELVAAYVNDSGAGWPGPAPIESFAVPRLVLPTSSRSLVESLPEDQTLWRETVEWIDEDWVAAAQADPAMAVVSTELPSPILMRAAEKIARERPDDAGIILCRADFLQGIAPLAVLGNLRWYGPTLGGLQDSPVACLRGVPQDIWQRAAHVQGELYTVSNPVKAVPDPPDEEANLRAIASALGAINEKDDWCWQLRREPIPNGQAVPGAGIQLWNWKGQEPEPILSEVDEGLLQGEHENWYRFKWGRGYRLHPLFGRKQAELLIDWPSPSPNLTDTQREVRSRTRTTVHDAFLVLATFGFTPTPVTTQNPWRRVERRGLVRARLLKEDLKWERVPGETLCGKAGDWMVWDRDPRRPWTVTVDDFAADYRQLGGADEDGCAAYQRIGVMRARPAVVGQTIETAEGDSTAVEGDWLLHAPDGREWHVQTPDFELNYRILGPEEEAVTSNQEWVRASRQGTVHAERLTEDRAWTRANGEPLQGKAGDWLVWDTNPEQPWTVTDEDFTAGYTPLPEPGRFSRTGEVEARPAVAGERIVTKEGASTADEGDWLLRTSEENCWFVSGDFFAANYRVCGPLLDGSGE